MDTSDKPMRYAGPLDLAHAHTKLNLVDNSEDAFTRDGPRADNEYRDLGLAAASGGRIGASTSAPSSHSSSPLDGIGTT
jgi:hypothetical protein